MFTEVCKHLVSHQCWCFGTLCTGLLLTLMRWLRVWIKDVWFSQLSSRSS